MSLRLNLNEVAHPNENKMIEWWAGILRCDVGQFQKTQFDSRSKSTPMTTDYHGVCTVTYGDTYLFERLTGVYLTYLDRKLEK